MKEEILSIASDLREGSMTIKEAKSQLLFLFGVSNSIKVDPNKVIKTTPRMIREDFRDTK